MIFPFLPIGEILTISRDYTGWHDEPVYVTDYNPRQITVRDGAGANKRVIKADDVAKSKLQLYYGEIPMKSMMDDEWAEIFRQFGTDVNARKQIAKETGVPFKKITDKLEYMRRDGKIPRLRVNNIKSIVKFNKI